MVYQMKIACGRSTDSPFGVAQVGPEGDATPTVIECNNTRTGLGSAPHTIFADGCACQRTCKAMRRIDALGHRSMTPFVY